MQPMNKMAHTHTYFLSNNQKIKSWNKKNLRWWRQRKKKKRNQAMLFYAIHSWIVPDVNSHDYLVPLYIQFSLIAHPFALLLLLILFSHLFLFMLILSFRVLKNFYFTPKLIRKTKMPYPKKKKHVWIE